MRYARLSPQAQQERAARVAAAYAADVPLKAIAAANDLSITQICTIARKAGLPKRDKTRMITPASVVAAVRADLAAGCPLPEIRRARRLTLRTVRRIAAEAALPAPRLKHQTSRAILAAMQDGAETIPALVAILGRPRAVVASSMRWLVRQKRIVRVSVGGGALPSVYKLAGADLPATPSTTFAGRAVSIEERTRLLAYIRTEYGRVDRPLREIADELDVSVSTICRTGRVGGAARQHRDANAPRAR